MTCTAIAPFPAPSALPFAALSGREWLLDCHCGQPVADFLEAQGWDVAFDLDDNVHCSGPDQRVYVGFLPEDPQRAAQRELWVVRVNRADGTTAWSQTFGLMSLHKPSPDSSVHLSPPLATASDLETAPCLATRSP
ncbi:hypothetical protein SAMN06272775_6006 [Streptomyces sp. 2323.1]|uniref:DUF317 domain-containing protein n=1 Tax=Streptomyces sp. 2323.1 TaxID=1938841 RepID=UPI000BC04DFD|nr:DUF317 domain-containing protein [Streptomyces sp. 2323.1]SOE15076.1 hypothetical protein SAMN06272775_6006 [Streptomyces sp. 2323.1]